MFAAEKSARSWSVCCRRFCVACNSAATPCTPAPFEIVSCDAFRKKDEGEWVAKKDTTVPGPGGLLQIKAGMPVDEQLQERLDAQCK